MKCIEDEIPFDLPNGWAWARLSSISEAISDGDHQPPPQSTSGIPFLVITNVSDGRLCFENTRFVPEKYYDSLSDTRKPQKGDILFTVTGSYGIPILIESNVEFCFQRHIAIIRPCLVSSEYTYVLLGSAHIKAICDNQATGVAQKTVSLTTLRDFLVPIAPYAEQLRIFARAQIALIRINDITSAKENLQDLINTAKSKILDLAIRGQLVPQNPDDEPASALLERIRAEKEELIKAGKIKRDKKESFIFKGEDNSYYRNDGKNETCIDNELPFAIPESWTWCNLSMIGSTNIGLTYKPTDICKEGIMVLRSSNIVDGQIDLTDLVRVSTPIRPNQYMEPNDILICARNGSKALVGKCAVFENIPERASFGAFMAVYRSSFYRYVYYYLNTDTFKDTFKNDDSKQINQLTQDMIKNTLIPLPPQKEQDRITSTISKLFEQIDRIVDLVQ